MLSLAAESVVSSVCTGLAGGAGQAARITATATRTRPRRVFTVSHGTTMPDTDGVGTDGCRVGIGAGAARRCAPWVQQQQEERPEQAAARTVHSAHTRSSTRGRAGHPAAAPHQLRVSGQFSACLTGDQNMGGVRAGCTR